MDDVNNMDESRETAEQSAGVTDEVLRTGVDRRTMLKAAVAAGTIAGTWVAPRIQTFGFAPAGAATPCEFTNPSNEDLQLNEADTTYVSSGRVRCSGMGSASFGAGGIDRIRFGKPSKPLLPGTDCTQFVVRTRPEDCPATTTTNVNDPDVTGFAVVVDLAESDPDCDCDITEVIITDSMGPVHTFTAAMDPFGACTDPITGNTGPGILVDFAKYGIDPCTLRSSARISVTIVCITTAECPDPEA